MLNKKSFEYVSLLLLITLIVFPVLEIFFQGSSVTRTISSFSAFILWLFFFRQKHVEPYLNSFRDLIVDNQSTNRKLHKDTDGFVDLFNQSKFYWVCIIIATTLSYGFTLTHFSIGVDDEVFHYYFQGHGLLMQGRWGSTILRPLFDSYLFLPFWLDFIALIFIVIGLTLFCGLFQKYSNRRFDDKASAIFSCIAISFPWIAHLFIFMAATLGIGLHLVFVGISLFLASKWIIDKKHFSYGIVGALSLGFATAFAETAMVFFMTIGFALILLKLMTSPDKEAMYLVDGIILFLKLIATVIVGLLIWRLGGVILLTIHNLSASGYVMGHQNLDTSSFIGFVTTFSGFLINFIQHRVLMVGNFVPTTIDRMIWVASIILIYIGTNITVALNRRAVLFITLMLVASAYGLIIVTGNTTPLLRITYTFSVLIAFCVALIYMLLQNISYKKFKIKYLVLFIALWLTLFQTREMNIIFFLDYQRYQRDVMVMNTIIHDLNGLERDKPIVFVGLLPNGLPINEVAGATLFNWSRSGTSHGELHTSRLFYFFGMHGFTINRFTQPIDIDQLRLQIAEMEMWPADGYIREFEDYVIVRLGPSRFHD